MAGRVQFGIRLPNSGPFASRGPILDAAMAAEDLGFDAVWVHDHIPWAREKLTHFAAGSVEAVHDQDPNFFESLSTLAFLGGMTRRVRLGVAGLVLPLRDPRVLAKQVATLQDLAQGRLILAMGIGNIPNDFEVMDVPFRRRGRIANEYLAALAAILSPSPQSTFEGERVRFRDGEFFPKPALVPIWIAGDSDPAYRRIARWGQGWLPAYLSPDEYTTHARRLAEHLAEAGRSPAEVVHGLELFVTVAPSGSQALEIARRSLEDKFKKLERGLAVNLVGSPEEIRDQIDRFRQAGVEYFELKFICHDPAAMVGMMEHIARSAIPEFVRR